jgi:hypothetical protein
MYSKYAIESTKKLLENSESNILMPSIGDYVKYKGWVI